MTAELRPLSPMLEAAADSAPQRNFRFSLREEKATHRKGRIQDASLRAANPGMVDRTSPRTNRHSE